VTPTATKDDDDRDCRLSHSRYHCLTDPPFRVYYRVRERCRVKVRLCGMDGKPVRDLVDSEHHPGAFEVSCDGRDDRGRTVYSGLYMITFQAKGRHEYRKVLILHR